MRDARHVDGGNPSSLDGSTSRTRDMHHSPGTNEVLTDAEVRGTSAVVLARRRLRKRVETLKQALEADPAQPDGWQAWLDGAASIEELHGACPQPGWLTYCAGLANTQQDALLEGALSCARLAAKSDPRTVVRPETVRRWADMSLPDLADTCLAIERRFPIARALAEALPAPTCIAMTPLYDGRIAAEASNPRLEPPPQAGPFRSGWNALESDEPDGVVAAGHVFAIEAVFLRHEGLREALVQRAAVAASLFRGSHDGYREAAVESLRQLFGWAT